MMNTIDDLREELRFERARGGDLQEAKDLTREEVAKALVLVEAERALRQRSETEAGALRRGLAEGLAAAAAHVSRLQGEVSGLRRHAAHEQVQLMEMQAAWAEHSKGHTVLLEEHRALRRQLEELEVRHERLSRQLVVAEARLRDSATDLPPDPRARAELW